MGGGQNKASSVAEVVENGKRETFGGGEFIHELEKKIRRRVTSYPAWVPWFCGFVRVAGLGGHIGGVLGATGGRFLYTRQEERWQIRGL